MFRLMLRFSRKSQKMSKIFKSVCSSFVFSAMHPILLLCSIAYVSGSELSSPDGICRYYLFQTKFAGIIFFKQNVQVSYFSNKMCKYHLVCKYEGSQLSKWSKNWLVGSSVIGPEALDLLWLPKKQKFFTQNVCITGIFIQKNNFRPIFF